MILLGLDSEVYLLCQLRSEVHSNLYSLERFSFYSVVLSLQIRSFPLLLFDYFFFLFDDLLQSSFLGLVLHEPS